MGLTDGYVDEVAAVGSPAKPSPTSPGSPWPRVPPTHDERELAKRIRAAADDKLSEADCWALARLVTDTSHTAGLKKMRAEASIRYMVRFHEGYAYINLKPKHGFEMLGAGVDKRVFRAVRVNVEEMTAEPAAHYKFTKGSKRRIREEAARLERFRASRYIVEAPYATLEYASSHTGAGCPAAYAPLYGPALQDAQPAVEDRAQLLVEAARGLRDMHVQNVCHRDVKGDNILLDRTQRHAMISDLGRSSGVGEESADAVRGNVYYSPPELWRGGSYEMAGDVWAFGITIYETLTGRELPCREQVVTPLRDSDGKRRAYTKFLREATQEQIYEGLEANENLSPALAGLIKECLQLEPNQRPTMQQVADKLAALGDGA